MLTITLLLVVAIISPSLGAPPTSPNTGNVVKRPGNGTPISDAELDAFFTIHRFNQIINQMVNAWTKVNARYSKKGNSLRLFNPRHVKENKVLNDEVDKFLADIASQIGSDLSCPDIEQPEENFKASSCHLSNMKTLKRTGNANIEKDSDSLLLRFPISFETLSVNYNHYALQLGPFYTHEGSLKSNLWGNSFQLSFKLKKTNADCEAQVNSLVLTNWDRPIDLYVENDIAGKIYDAIQEAFEGTIKPALENLMSQFIRGALSKVTASSQMCNIE